MRDQTPQPWEQFNTLVDRLCTGGHERALKDAAFAARAADAETIRQQAQRIAELEAALARPEGGQ